MKPGKRALHDRWTTMKAHFHVLDGFRGIAAIAVVVAHGWVLLGYKVAVHGYLAVDVSC
jgi:peptidoglycan/LPS O-acetylase OafA/YrhL